MKKLPLSTQDFATLREKDFVYVDKTKYVYEVINDGRVNFLSRPRRFGKSLLINTFKELFEGNKELFKGLYIYGKWDWDKSFPVIQLDMSDLDYENKTQLNLSLDELLNTIALKFSVTLNNKTLKMKFTELISKIYDSYNQKVVVLIDEYDKPILDTINDEKLSEDILNVLSSFYGVLKSNDSYIEFIFLTGVTKLGEIGDFAELENLRFSKFSKTSIFSGLNNLTDITLNPKFANICGYTQEELENCFNERIVDLASYYDAPVEELMNSIKQWYNGYSYNGEDFLYNPFSILSLFNEKEFDNYWFESGTPSFLSRFIRDKNYTTDVLFNPKPVIHGFPNFKIDNLDFTTVLLQTGYLTIKEKEVKMGELRKYTLGIPNKEVKDSLFSYILGEYTNTPPDSIIPLGQTMLDQIVKGDEVGLQRSFDVLIGNIPHTLYDNVKKEIREANYHMMFLSWLQILGLEIQGEVVKHKGRIDAILKKENIVVVIEIKYSLNKSLDAMLKEADAQIHDKEYYKPYLDKNIILLKIAIKDREIACNIEKIDKV